MNGRDRRNSTEKNNKKQNKTITYVQKYKEGVILKHKGTGKFCLFSLNK